MKDIIKILGGVVVAIGIFLVGQGTVIEEKSLGGANDLACSVTESIVSIGHQEATQIIANRSDRAWATIQQPVNATNTVSTSLGGIAVSGQGYQLLDIATSTGVDNVFTFGLSTDLPYLGAVSAITNNGSTTVKILECRY